MGNVLLVDDDERFRSATARELQPMWLCVHAATVAEAARLLSSELALRGAVIDVHLPDGSGLKLLRRMRALRGSMPVLIVSGDIRPEFANQSQQLGAEFAYKLDWRLCVRAFSARLDAASSDRNPKRLLIEYASSMGLSPRETEILCLAVGDAERQQIADLVGITMNTLKTHVRSLLAKCGEDSLSVVARKLRAQRK